jgi:hypothetical protein
MSAGAAGPWGTLTGQVLTESHRVGLAVKFQPWEDREFRDQEACGSSGQDG